MKRRSRWLALILALLSLAGCSLARSEVVGPEGGDRFVGFFVVPLRQYGEDAFSASPYKEEYGAFSAETERFGAVSFPREVLFAEEDGTGKFTFPGIEEGYRLFVYRDYEDGSQGGVNYAVAVASDMAPGGESNQCKYTDEGISEIVSGTLYYGPPLGAEDWDPYVNRVIWQYYRVYQTPEGRVYIDGSGDSAAGPMAGYTAEETRTRTENGKSYTDVVRVTVNMEAVRRLERLTVIQFGADNSVLRTDDLPLTGEELPEVLCEEGTGWVLVEERGGEETVRTVYNVPEEEPVSHRVVLLDEAGLGRTAGLTVRGA